MLCRPASVSTAFLGNIARFKGSVAGEFMQDSLANVSIEIGASKFFALLTQADNPRFILRTKFLFELLANSLRQSWALTCGGDCDLQVSSTHDGRVVEVAIRGIVNGVAKDASRVSFGEHAFVDVARGSSNHDQELPLKIARLECALVPGDDSCFSPLTNLSGCFGGHDLDGRALRD